MLRLKALIWLRGSAERWLERKENEAVRSAYDRLKAFPENLPDEQAWWYELRIAFAKVLGQDEVPPIAIMSPDATGGI
jgi:hypothetical protein